MYRRCVFVRCWPQKSHSYTLNNVQRTITFIGRGHCLPGDVSVRARFIYGILTWERRFDKWSSLRVRLYFSVRRRTLVKRRWPKTHARARGSSVKVIAGGGGHTRRLIPMENRNDFYHIIYFRTCHCRAAALGTILCVRHIIFAWHNNIYINIWYTIRVPTII